MQAVFLLTIVLLIWIALWRLNIKHVADRDSDPSLGSGIVPKVNRRGRQLRHHTLYAVVSLVLIALILTVWLGSREF